MNEFDKLIDIVKKLRAPDGCPWDRKQTLYSLKDALIEETCELIDALDNKDIENIKEELGDVLLHVVFHSQTACEDGLFNIEDVICGINEKLIRRHPHVFKNEHYETAEQVKERWDEIKKEENSKIFFEGQIYDAYSKILEIFKEAEKELIIIDAYADNVLLNIIKRLDISITLITKKDNLSSKQDILKYKKQYHNLKVIYDNTFHDRYFILDNNIVYHCGASINRIGYKTFSINLINDKDVCDMLKSRIKEIV